MFLEPREALHGITDLFSTYIHICILVLSGSNYSEFQNNYKFE